jgi:eukaryotic-like serine/threonine-protein kinase
MGTRLSLTAVWGELQEREFVFVGPSRCCLGRSHECTLCLPPKDLAVSRRHCLLEIGGADVRVQDLDSLNGTYVNGAEVGPEDAQAGGRRLISGDELRVGHTVFRIGVTAEPEPAAQPQSA